jgi:hypothetical protein
VEVRAHCRIRHRPPRTFLAGAPPCHGCTPLASHCLPSLVFWVCLEPLMLTGPANRVTPPRSSPEPVSHGRGPPLLSPTALATTIAPLGSHHWGKHVGALDLAGITTGNELHRRLCLPCSRSLWPVGPSRQSAGVGGRPSRAARACGLRRPGESARGVNGPRVVELAR